MEKKKGTILLVLIVAVGYALHSFYLDWQVRNVWEENFGEAFSPECNSYDTISDNIDQSNMDLVTRQKKYDYKNLGPKEKIAFARRAINEEFADLASLGVPEKTAILGRTANDNVAQYYFESMSLNALEEGYAVLSDIMPNEKPETCDVKRDDETAGHGLLLAQVMTEQPVFTSALTNAYDLNVNYCNKQQDNNSCIMKALVKLIPFAENKKAVLKEYETLTPPEECRTSLAYNAVKNTEKRLREQLENSKDPYSIAVKSISISIYADCSKQMLEDIRKQVACRFIPRNKAEAIGLVISDMDSFVSCSTDRVASEGESFKKALTLEGALEESEEETEQEEQENSFPGSA